MKKIKFNFYLFKGIENEESMKELTKFLLINESLIQLTCGGKLNYILTNKNNLVLISINNERYEN